MWACCWDAEIQSRKSSLTNRCTSLEHCSAVCNIQTGSVWLVNTVLCFRIMSHCIAAKVYVGLTFLLDAFFFWVLCVCSPSVTAVVPLKWMRGLRSSRSANACQNKTLLSDLFPLWLTLVVLVQCWCGPPAPPHSATFDTDAYAGLANESQPH